MHTPNSRKVSWCWQYGCWGASVVGTRVASLFILPPTRTPCILYTIYAPPTRPPCIPFMLPPLGPPCILFTQWPVLSKYDPLLSWPYHGHLARHGITRQCSPYLAVDIFWPTFMHRCDEIRKFTYFKKFKSISIEKSWYTFSLVTFWILLKREYNDYNFCRSFLYYFL